MQIGEVYLLMVFEVDSYCRYFWRFRFWVDWVQLCRLNWLLMNNMKTMGRDCKVWLGEVLETVVWEDYCVC